MNALNFTPANMPHFIVPELLPAWNASGILEEKGSKSWIGEVREQDDTPRIQQILLYALRSYGDEKKKFGPRPPVSHKIRGANLIFNLKGLKELGVDPFLAAFIYAAHDIRETLRERAKKAGIPYTDKDDAAVLDKISRILDDPHQDQEMREALNYITDDPKIPYDLRLYAQIVKSFDMSTGECNISDMWQLIRTVDKWEQGTGDKWSRENGYLPDDRVGRMAQKAYDRGYVLRFPFMQNFPRVMTDSEEAWAYLQREHMDVVRRSGFAQPAHRFSPQLK